MASKSAAAIESLYSTRARQAPPVNTEPEFPVTVNFDQGLPDPRSFAIEAITRHLIATLDADGVDALRYFGSGGASEMQYGYVGLRAQLAQWMARRDGRDVGRDGVALVNGSTDGLALAVNAFLGPGDGAIVESATYPHTRRFMNVTGATVRVTPLDEDGMDVDALARHSRSRAVTASGQR